LAARFGLRLCVIFLVWDGPGDQAGQEPVDEPRAAGPARWTRTSTPAISAAVPAAACALSVPSAARPVRLITTWIPHPCR